jgi:hypothetical protein
MIERRIKKHTEGRGRRCWQHVATKESIRVEISYMAVEREGKDVCWSFRML